MPKITETVEPEKSTFLLSAQRTLMNASFLRPVAQAVSWTFYNAEGSLRPVWKPFTHQGRGYKKTVTPDNASVAEIIQKHPGRLYGWIMLNPRAGPDPLAELNRWRRVPGMIGLKLHPYWHQFSLRAAAPVLAEAQRLKLPVMVHLGFGGQGDYRWVFESYPELCIIFAHAGIPFYKSLWPSVRGRKNTYMDLSSPHLSEAFVRKAVRALGAEKCLYGTDSPYGFGASHGDYDYGRILGWIQRLPVSTQERDAILGGNFSRLIGAAASSCVSSIP